VSGGGGMVRAEVRVIYGDTDQMGIAYYANYLRWFEVGRNEFLRARGLRYRDFEATFSLRLPVAEAHVGYATPARYDDVLAIETTIEDVKRASARFTYRIVRDGEVVATGYTLHACVDLDGRIRRMPQELVSRLSGTAPGPAQE
jgi:acyl-CoA thioester hydrolase